MNKLDKGAEGGSWPFALPLKSGRSLMSKLFGEIWYSGGCIDTI